MNRPFTWGDANRAIPHDDLAGAVSSAQCSLCGIVLPVTLMVPDGGQACADIRWYCQDAKSCTERWTASLPRHAHIAPTPPSLARPAVPMAASGPAPATGRRRSVASGPVPAELRGGPVQEAWSVDPS